MKPSEITTKESFENFCRKEFPNKATCWYDNYCYVQAGTHMGEDLHYEFVGGYVCLHIEGPSRIWRGIRNYLMSKQPIAHIHSEHWWRANCCWKLDTKPTNENQLFSAFRSIRNSLEPHILEYEKSNGSLLQEENGTNNLRIQSSIVSVAELLKENLSIPQYQRPYRWNTKNVRQLLEDIHINFERRNARYRIGSVILHDNNGVMDLVDGQQRVTTICLILKVCECEADCIQLLKYNHNDSFNHIKENHSFIKEWIGQHISNKNLFSQYLSEQCEFVRIVVKDRSEAFQMFDSQNGRGKELEAYNLLKAYHIRAMEQNSREEKVRCDVRWEDATQYDATPLIPDDANVDLLKQLFSEQLYRSRRWTRETEAREFKKKDIDEFKGFTIDKNHPIVYPYQNPQLLQYLTAKFYHSTLEGTIATSNRFQHGDSDNIDPFVNINQIIVNGKSFFDYVETYVELYKRLFLNMRSSQLDEFKNFYYLYCLDYDCEEKDVAKKRKHSFSHLPSGGARRTGDTYLRELYKSLVLVLFDKFGEQALNRYYKTLYRLVYALRLEKYQVRYDTVCQMPHEYFAAIHKAKDMADLTVLETKLKSRTHGLKIVYDNIPKRIKNMIENGK